MPPLNSILCLPEEDDLKCRKIEFVEKEVEEPEEDDEGVENFPCDECGSVNSPGAWHCCAMGNECREGASAGGDYASVYAICSVCFDAQVIKHADASGEYLCPTHRSTDASDDEEEDDDYTDSEAEAAFMSAAEQAADKVAGK